MKFFLPMEPPTTTHQEKAIRVQRSRTGKVYPVVYEPPELKAARAKLTAAVAQHRPAQPMGGALRLLVKWCFPRTGNHMDGEYRTSKPDTDNLQKLLKDCMTARGYWKDDAQVASEICEKFWADVPGIYIEVQPLDQPPSIPRSQYADLAALE